MTNNHVMLPILGHPVMDAQYDSILAQLNERHATVHLIAQADSSLLSGADKPLNDRQRQQLEHMTLCLKCEALDRLVDPLRSRFPEIEFEFHAPVQALEKTLITLCARFDAQAIIVDDRALSEQAGSSLHAALQNLATHWDMPVWHVGAATSHNITGLPNGSSSALYSAAAIARASSSSMPTPE